MRVFIVGPCILLALALADGLVVKGDDRIQPADRIIFSHRLHVDELEISCLDCHTESGTVDIPSMESCESCHDVDDDSQCGVCHTYPEEPAAFESGHRDYRFDHAVHSDEGLECGHCHVNVEDDPVSYSAIPGKSLCMDCHDDHEASQDCELCHGDEPGLRDIHPADWLNHHGEEAALSADWCATCHESESYCQECHLGDNLEGRTHGLNYLYTHGLDVTSKEIDCAQCHDSRAFCNECHLRELRIPWQHSTLVWMHDHGDEARQDPENCASCHDQEDPTCARTGCHVDRDGIRGTDPPIHSSSSSRFESAGAWHDDPGYFCFQCHTDTKLPNSGFCGYCHE